MGVNYTALHLCWQCTNLEWTKRRVAEYCLFCIVIIFWKAFSIIKTTYLYVLLCINKKDKITNRWNLFSIFNLFKNKLNIAEKIFIYLLNTLVFSEIIMTGYGCKCLAFSMLWFLVMWTSLIPTCIVAILYERIENQQVT